MRVPECLCSGKFEVAGTGCTVLGRSSEPGNVTLLLEVKELL